MTRSLKLIIFAAVTSTVVGWKIAARDATGILTASNEATGSNESKPGYAAVRVPGDGYCKDALGHESTARVFFKAQCAGAKLMCSRDEKCVAWACQDAEADKASAVLYTNTGCCGNSTNGADCMIVDWILDPSLIVQAGHDAANVKFDNGQCWKWVKVSEHEEEKKRLLKLNRCLITEDVTGARVHADQCVRDDEGHVQHGETCTYQAKEGWDCQYLDTLCENSNLKLPICTPKKCMVRDIAGAEPGGNVTCKEGDMVQHGTECSWTTLPTHTCLKVGPHKCSYGEFEGLPECARKCELPTDIEATYDCQGIGSDAPKLVADGYGCKWTAKSTHTCTETDTKCVESQWDAVPFCVPKCHAAVPTGSVLSGCQPDKDGLVVDGTLCTWTEDDDYTCPQQGDHRCTNGAFAVIECFPKCPKPDTTGIDSAVLAASSCGMDKIPSGRECNFKADDKHVCTPEGTYKCEAGSFNQEFSCTKKCLVVAVDGSKLEGEGCEHGAYVDPGTSCKWTVKDESHTCSGMGTHTCVSGPNFPGAERSCDGKCTLGSADGAKPAVPHTVGDELAVGKTVEWTALSNYDCPEVGPFECVKDCPDCITSDFNGRPTCLEKCHVQSIVGATLTGCQVDGDYTSSGSNCKWQAKAGFTCTNVDVQCNAASAGKLALPTCGRNCPADDVIVEGTTPGTSGEIPHGQAVTYTLQVGWECQGSMTRTCNDGTLTTAPVCQGECNIDEFIIKANGGVTSSCSGIVPSGTQCMFFQQAFWRCGSPRFHRSCSGGTFGDIDCKKMCEVPRRHGLDISVNDACVPGALVPHGSTCIQKQASGWTCTNGEEWTATCTGEVTDPELTPAPICKASCTMDKVHGANAPDCNLDAEGGVPDGTTCRWEAEDGLTCTGSMSTTCSNGIVSNNGPHCTTVAEYPTCKAHANSVWYFCGGNPVGRWGIGPEGEQGAIGNCNYAAKTQKRWGTCATFDARRWSSWSNDYHACNDPDNKRRFHNGKNLEACKAQCLNEGDCVAIYGNVHRDGTACWTYPGSCSEVIHQNAYKVLHLLPEDDMCFAVEPDAAGIQAYANVKEHELFRKDLDITYDCTFGSAYGSTSTDLKATCPGPDGKYKLRGCAEGVFCFGATFDEAGGSAYVNIQEKDTFLGSLDVTYDCTDGSIKGLKATCSGVKESGEDFPKYRISGCAAPELCYGAEFDAAGGAAYTNIQETSVFWATIHVTYDCKDGSRTGLRATCTTPGGKYLISGCAN